MGLYASCYLHDIGMQYENAGDTVALQGFTRDCAWTSLGDDARRRLLRDHHHAIAAEMIMQSIDASKPIVGMSLPREYERVASLCEAHATEMPSAHYDKLTQDSAGIRMAFLAGLLRVADILDEPRSRAPREKAQTLILDMDSQCHWWRHNCVEEVKVIPEKGLIEVWFDFPPVLREEYAAVVPKLQMPLIEEELSRQQPVFHKNRLGWSLQHLVCEKVHSAAEVIPEDVLTAMQKQLQARKGQEAEERKQALLHLFKEAVPGAKRRLDKLAADEKTMPADEYLRSLQAVARDFWDLGAKRSAWIALWNPFSQKGGALKPIERLEMGIELAAWMLSDDEADQATRVLAGIRESAEAEGTNNKCRFQFWRTFGRCLSDANIYNGAVGAIEKAIGLAPDLAARIELTADLVELHFLHGEFQKAAEVEARRGGAP